MSNFSGRIPININQFSTNQNHPLIPNQQEYRLIRKYVSIHSDDRNEIKYPNSNEFEIELPQDYLNVLSVRLSDWTFPSNYDVFSLLNGNISMTFQINSPYNPGEHMLADPLQNAIFTALYSHVNKNYLVGITPGFYNPGQITAELTRQFNNAVSRVITRYFTNDPSLSPLLPSFAAQGGYTEFKIVYNNVQQNIWFGNTSSSFTLTNTDVIKAGSLANNLRCNRKLLPEYSNWGLPDDIGLPRCDVSSESSSNPNDVRFINNVFPGDNGYWLLPNPNLPGAQINFYVSPFKINLMGPSHFYMEIEGMNCIDETAPFNVSDFTLKTNETNGIVNSSFAKIAIPTTPISQWFDRESLPYKYYNPPAERIRKLYIKLRYHNGQLVDFGTFPYTFTLEFTILQNESILGMNINPLSTRIRI